MEDCLYEDIPEMGDTSSTLSSRNLASSSLNEAKNVAKSIENDASVRKTTKKSVKKCLCRESIQWTWDSDSKSDFVEIRNHNMDVRFHKHYSNGTAVVRCTEPMTNNQYYWEVKMTYPVYGTDIMVGVGTSAEKLKHLKDRFVSFLGMDNKTWGFSYTGLFHHNGQRRCYAQSFGQGSIIGVHLDLWRGTLSFYKDKKHLGVASSGLKGKTLYAMASSTAAHSGMRIIRSCSFPSSLQFLCCTKLREIIPDDKNVLDVIQLPPGLKHFLQNKLSWLLEKRLIEQTPKIKTCCVANDSHVSNNDHCEDQQVADESPPGENNSSNSDPYGINDQFIVLGSLLLQDHTRIRQAIRRLSSEDTEGSENEPKRRRRSYNYAVGLSDHDSD